MMIGCRLSVVVLPILISVTSPWEDCEPCVDLSSYSNRKIGVLSEFQLFPLVLFIWSFALAKEFIFWFEVVGAFEFNVLLRLCQSLGQSFHLWALYCLQRTALSFFFSLWGWSVRTLDHCYYLHHEACNLDIAVFCSWHQVLWRCIGRASISSLPRAGSFCSCWCTWAVLVVWGSDG